MDFIELLQKRRACHNFKPNSKIADQDLIEIIKQAGMSPSGYNAQPWEFVIVREPHNIQKIHQIAYQQDHIKDASAIIVVLGDTIIGRNVDALLKDWVKLGYCTEEEVPVFKNSIAKNRKKEKLEVMALRNAMLASMTLIFAAENMGYATCPIMGFSQKELTEELNIPEDRTIALMVAIGTSTGETKKRLPRKSPEEMIHWERCKEID